MQQPFTQRKNRNKKTIWIADTTQIARIGMRNIASSVRMRATIKEVASFEELAVKCKDVVAGGKHFYIGDSQLSADTGIVDIVREMTFLDPETHFLFLTNVDARIFEPVAFEPLAMAEVDCTFISKDDRDVEQKVKEWFLSRKKGKEVLEEGHPMSDGIRRFPNRSRLSKREFSILEGLLAGQSRQRIADQLQLKYPTVATYIDRIYRKMGVKSLHDVFLVATELGGVEKMKLYT